MPNTVTNTNSVSTTVVTTAETVVLTCAPFTYDFPNPYVGAEHSGAGQGVTVKGIVNVAPAGTGATAATVRVRQGSVTGTVVGASLAQTVAAGNSTELTYWAQDTSRFAAQAGGGVYVVTVQFTGATGNSTVTYAAADVGGV
jgi:hypothetical protein